MANRIFLGCHNVLLLSGGEFENKTGSQCPAADELFLTACLGSYHRYTGCFRPVGFVPSEHGKRGFLGGSKQSPKTKVSCWVSQQVGAFSVVAAWDAGEPDWTGGAGHLFCRGGGREAQRPRAVGSLGLDCLVEGSRARSALGEQQVEALDQRLLTGDAVPGGEGL